MTVDRKKKKLCIVILILNYLCKHIHMCNSWVLRSKCLLKVKQYNDVPNENLLNFHVVWEMEKEHRYCMSIFQSGLKKGQHIAWCIYMWIVLNKTELVKRVKAESNIHVHFLPLRQFASTINSWFGSKTSRNRLLLKQRNIVHFTDSAVDNTWWQSLLQLT